MERPWLWPKKEYRNEGNRQGNDKGNFKRIEVLDKKKSDEYSADDGPGAFKDIDPSNGRDLLPDVLGIESTSVSEKGTLWKCYREEDQERRIENCRKTESLSWSEMKNVFEYSAEIDGDRKGHSKKKLEEHKGFHSTFYFFYSACDQRADRDQDKPVSENDSKGELVPLKRDKEFSHQNDLGDDTAQSLYEERGFKRSSTHLSLQKLKFSESGVAG